MTPKWFKIAPKMAQDSPKWVQKGSQNDPKMVKDCLKLPKIYNICNANLMFWIWVSPSWLKMVQKWPEMAQDGPKKLQDGPKMASGCPKMAQDGPKKLQDGPEMDQDGPKMAPRWPQDRPRWRQRPDVLVVALLDPRHPGPYITL